MIFNLVHFTQLQFANTKTGRPVRFIAYLPELQVDEQVLYSAAVPDYQFEQELFTTSANALENGVLELQTSTTLQAVVDLAVDNGYRDHCLVFPELRALVNSNAA